MNMKLLKSEECEQSTSWKVITTIFHGAAAEPRTFGSALSVAVVFLVAALIYTAMCYSPVCVNAFLSDDYLHVTWLRDAAANPQLVLRNFYTSWLDGSSAKFYRPLISVFMFTDYKLWGADARGFHLTNILFHLAGATFLFGIGYELAKSFAVRGREQSNDFAKGFIQRYGFALCGSALFALYPLHPEAVSWITGRVDCVVTAFFLGSVWCYMRWQCTGLPRTLFLSLFLFCLSLMSKEMAVVLPATLTSLELFIGKAPWLQRARRVAPFWCTLAIYFVVRKFALGTFVGGYDDSLSLTNISAIALNWKHGIMKVFAPVNTELVERHNFAFQIWQRSWRPIIAASLIAALTNKRRAGVYAFLLSWFLFSLLPVYKIFWISDNLEGSRLAYLATAPLCLAMAFGIMCWHHAIPRLNWVVPAVQIAFGALICWSASSLLISNNQAWASAGLQMQAIHKGMQGIYSQLKGDPDVLLMGVPDSYKGAYMGRNAIGGLSRKPLIDRDISNALLIDKYEPIFPFGARKNYLALYPETSHVFRWDDATQRFNETRLSAHHPQMHGPIVYEGIQLKEVLTPVEQVGVHSTWDGSGSLSLAAGADVRPQVVFHDKNIEPFDLDYLGLSLTPQRPQSQAVAFDVLYTTDLSQSFRFDKRIHQELPVGATNVVIGLRSYPEWAFAKHPARLAIVFPAGWTGSIRRLEVIPPAHLTPAIEMTAPHTVASQGVLAVGGKSGNQAIVVDASKVPNAASAELEISRCNVFFEEQNTAKRSKITWRTIPVGRKERLAIKAEDFPATGLYQARAWAKDGTGTDVGPCSDHILIMVSGPPN